MNHNLNAIQVKSFKYPHLKRLQTSDYDYIITDRELKIGDGDTIVTWTKALSVKNLFTVFCVLKNKIDGSNYQITLKAMTNFPEETNYRDNDGFIISCKIIKLSILWVNFKFNFPLHYFAYFDVFNAYWNIKKKTLVQRLSSIIP